MSSDEKFSIKCGDAYMDMHRVYGYASCSIEVSGRWYINSCSIEISGRRYIKSYKIKISKRSKHTINVFNTTIFYLSLPIIAAVKNFTSYQMIVLSLWSNVKVESRELRHYTDTKYNISLFKFDSPLGTEVVNDYVLFWYLMVLKNASLRTSLNQLVYFVVHTRCKW